MNSCGGMPSIKKAVYGIFRQFSSNSVAPSSSANNGQTPDDGSTEELIQNVLLEPVDPCATTSAPLGPHKTTAAYGRKYYQTGGGDATRYDSNWRSCNVIIEGEGEQGSTENGIHLTEILTSYTCNYLTNGVPLSNDSVGSNMADTEHSFIHTYLSGRLKKPHQPEIYFGKTGVDLPMFHIVPLDPAVYASYSGPDGGLTQVPSVTRRPLANIANLDDELNLSCDADLDGLSSLTSRGIFPSPPVHRRPLALNGAPPHRTQSLNSNVEQDCLPVCYETKLDWSQWHDGAYGHSTSLYECHPFTKVHAGNPVADVFAVCSRQNSCVLALADGVNWGEKSRLAARCAIRGAMEHLDDVLYNQENPVLNTLDIFHALLGAFHTGHQLIIQEAGSLTTLCVVVVTQLKGDSQWVVCACNVGDSLAFVYSEKSGVREVTLGSHDIQQMRDMRDAGGALGPVDGVNPELHNMTCSMTTVDPGDIVFITSDGVSDNFDPVVGKFCVIRDGKNIEGGGSAKSPTLGGRKADPNTAQDGAKADSHLPVVEAHQRHELMLLRMEDLLRHGVTAGDPSIKTARDLCENLINFATQLTTAKRKILEDPELYQGENELNQRDQRTRRRLVKQRISEMPGKLDHATVVAYVVGEYPMSASSSLTDEDSMKSVQETPYPLSSETDDNYSTLKRLTTADRTDHEQSPSDTNAATETPKAKRGHTPATVQSLASTPTSPDWHPDDPDSTAVPPIPTQPPPHSSSDEEDEDAWSEKVQTARGPYEPKLAGFVAADGNSVDGELVEGNRVRMIDESSVSSVSGCGSTPVPPADEDDEDAFMMGLDSEDLMTPAQETMPPWPAVKNEKHGQSRTDGDGKQEIHPDSSTGASLSASNTENDILKSTLDSSPISSTLPCPTSLPIQQCAWKSVDVNLELNSPETINQTLGSISIKSVLECCDLIIKDTDVEPEPEPIKANRLSLKSIDSPSRPQSLIELPEDRVVSIFDDHGLPTAAIRWPPAENRKIASKCISLPICESGDKLSSVNEESTDDGRGGPVRRGTLELRCERSLMNESYYMATSGEEVTSGRMAQCFDRGANARLSSGRLGKLSKAFDRLERVVTGRRKHDRGSPNRHTVATDSSQWAEMKQTTPLSSRTTPQQKPDTPASPSKRFSTSSIHLAWSPVKTLRALASPRRQPTGQMAKVKEGQKNSPAVSPAGGDPARGPVPAPAAVPALGSQRKQQRMKVNIRVVDTTADVIVEKDIGNIVESVAYCVPHSISDSEIVSGRIPATPNGNGSGRESEV